jgi:hypothetical protein
MKKLISILVVFALATTAVIAQEGSWSIGGSGEISTIFNFVPREVNSDPDSDPAPEVGVHAYNNYGYYGASTGSLSATYSNGDVSAGISFDPSDDVYLNAKYDSGDIAFYVETGLSDLIKAFKGSTVVDTTAAGYDADDPDTWVYIDGPATFGGFNVARLWGYYKFLDGAIHLEVAMNSRDTNYWISNEVVGNIFDSASSPKWHGGLCWEIGWGFTSVDHHNYLLADFNLSSLVDGLSFGFMLPGIFNYAQGDGGKWGAGGAPGPGRHPVGYGTAVTVKSVFQQIRFGVKYASGPIDAALQFALLGPATNDPDDDSVNSGLYFGLNYNINDQMKAGLGLEGHFDGDNSDSNEFAFGVSFSYGDGPFSAGIEGGLYFGAKNGPTEKGVLGIRPKISYNLVDNYLNLTLDAFLFFPFDTDLDKRGLGFEITPELSFNVMGTGAGQGYYWPNATAIILRYKVAGWAKTTAGDDQKTPIYNAVDLTFKWSF